MLILRAYSIVCLLLISTVTCDVLSKDVFQSLNRFLSEDSKNGYNKSEQTSSAVSFRTTADYDNETCNFQIQMLLEGVLGFEMWALEVIDSWGKLPSGLLQFHYQEWGNFDQCLDVLQEAEANSGQMNGQYCIATLGVSGIDLPMPFRLLQNPAIDGLNVNPNLRMPIAPGILGIQLGICIPNACSPEYFLEMMTNFTASPIIEGLPNNVGLQFMAIDKCQQKEEVQFDALDIVAICFFSFIGCLLISSTIYDVVVTYTERSKNPNLIAFSMYTNGEKIFKCNRSKSENVLDCLNGIRVLSIVWVVFAHAYGTVAARPHMNPIGVMSWIESYFALLILNATVSVDSFFVLSGFLVCWSLLRHLEQNKGRVNIFLMYFHRYLRLTPAFAVAILFYVSLFRYIGSGPIWDSNMDKNCGKWWWSALLYVQNYVNPKEMCLGHSWYLSVDMQLFILSPFFIYPLWRWKHKFTPVIVLVILLSMACTFTVYMINEFKSGFLSETTLQRMQKTYHPTHTRMGVWFCGVFLGYILHALKGRTIRLPKILVLIGWTASLATIFSVIFAAYDLNQVGNNTTVLENAFYEVFSRITWGISLCWIIFACVHGYGGPINWFLSWPQWQPLARLSYSIYILHMPIQEWLATSVKTSTYFSDLNAIHIFWGDFGFTLTLAVFWVMAFESPILTLEKLLLVRAGGDKAKPTAKVNENHIDHIENGHHKAGDGYAEKAQDQLPNGNNTSEVNR